MFGVAQGGAERLTAATVAALACRPCRLENITRRAYQTVILGPAVLASNVLEYEKKCRDG